MEGQARGMAKQEMHAFPVKTIAASRTILKSAAKNVMMGEIKF